MDQLQSMIPRQSDYAYELVRTEIPTPKAVFSNQVKRNSRWAQLQLLLENPNRMWFDCDITCNEWPVLEDKDYCYGGKCSTSILRIIERDKIEKLIKLYEADRGIRCPHNYLPNGLEPIDIKYFKHYRLSTLSGKSKF